MVESDDGNNNSQQPAYVDHQQIKNEEESFLQISINNDGSPPPHLLSVKDSPKRQKHRNDEYSDVDDDVDEMSLAGMAGDSGTVAIKLQ